MSNAEHRRYLIHSFAAFPFIGLPFTGFLVSLAATASLGACAKPEPNPDGKPVAISPMGSRKGDSARLRATEAAPAAVRGPSLQLADFEKGSHDGSYIQERCSDGLRGTTLIEGVRISLRTEIFLDSKCKEPVETSLSVWKLKAIEGNVADLVPTRETRTLFLESEVTSANDPQSPVCAVGWSRAVERDISSLGECYLDTGFHTLLSIEGDKLRWGASGQDPGSNEVLDGSTLAKRHRRLEELPYTRVASSTKADNAAAPQAISPEATRAPSALGSGTPSSVSGN